MQIVIEIPEEMYQKIKETNMVISGRRNGKMIDYILFNAVDVGTPLPKGHGRLIDADRLKIDNPLHLSLDIPYVTEDTVEEIIDHAPTIIEADKEG